MVPVFIMRNRMFPKSPLGKNTDKPKNPFHRHMNIGKDHHPQTGQIAIIIEMMLTNPTTAPIEISFGLYSSTSVIPEILGIIKVVNNMIEIIIV